MLLRMPAICVLAHTDEHFSDSAALILAHQKRLSASKRLSEDPSHPDSLPAQACYPVRFDPNPPFKSAIENP